MSNKLYSGLSTRYNQAKRFFRQAGLQLKRDYIDPVTDQNFWRAIPESVGSWSDQGKRAAIAIPAMVTNLPSDVVNVPIMLNNTVAGVTNWALQRPVFQYTPPMRRVIGGKGSGAILELNGEWGKSADAVNGVDVIGAAAPVHALTSKALKVAGRVTRPIARTTAKLADKVLGDEVAIMSGRRMSDLAKSGGLPTHRSRFLGAVPQEPEVPGSGIRNQAPLIRENTPKSSLPDVEGASYASIAPGTWFRVMTPSNPGPGVRTFTDITKHPTYFTPNYGVVTHGSYSAYVPSNKHTIVTPITIATSGENMILRSPQGHPIAVPDFGAHNYIFNANEIPRRVIVSLPKHRQHAFNQLGRLATYTKSGGGVPTETARYRSYLFGDPPEIGQLLHHENVRSATAANDVTDMFVTDVKHGSPWSVHYGFSGARPQVSFERYVELPTELKRKMFRLLIRRMFPQQ